MTHGKASNGLYSLGEGSQQSVDYSASYHASTIGLDQSSSMWYACLENRSD